MARKEAAMTPIETIYHYHDTTKHRPQRYARSLGYMDWATQPDPFRRYMGAPLVRLPLALENATPPYHLLFERSLPKAPLCRESLSQLMQFSLGLAAWKGYGSERWALRCNASSGNLQPSEAYLICPPIEGISSQSFIAHYAPKEHALEILATFDTDYWQTQPEGSFFLALSSVLWREAWKYGERSFRYCQLDAGHAQQAVAISGKMLGWNIRRATNVHSADIERLSGIGIESRFLHEERESADMLLLINSDSCVVKELIDDLPLHFDSVANRLSHSHHPWEILERIDAATQGLSSSLPTADAAVSKREPTKESKEVVLKRRSAQAMNKQNASITIGQFQTLMQSVAAPLDSYENAAHLLLFIHAVETLESGLYLLLRNNAHLQLLKDAMDETFEWSECDKGLYRLRSGDYRAFARMLSCSQDIASDGAFTLGMLCEFAPQIERYGPQRYKELYFECGAIGQQLYLEATAIGLNATGIGCFLDDELHNMLGLRDTAFQSLYHFTVGRAIVDMRLQSDPPYESIPER